MIELLLWPFVAGLVLTGIHAWFGLHVLARGVVFVDLSLAQVAALGMTVAILAGHPPHGEAAYWYALAFALAGAVLFALARPYEKSLQQEAVIGIAYAVATSLGVLALDRAPQGAEHIKQLLIGSILTVTAAEVGQLAVLYALVGLVHVVFRRQIIAASFGTPQGQQQLAGTLLWDVLFYASFAVVVTSSVRLAGVLLVFSYLIVPAVLAGLAAARLGARLALAWVLGAVLTGAGLVASWSWDLPTGPAIVAVFGVAVAGAVVVLAARHITRRGLAVVSWAALALAGALLTAFPRMDHLWLDALENVAPPIQMAFLSTGERATRAETLGEIARAKAELVRLRALEQDVRWGKAEMAPDKAEQLRQYLAGRSEISAGDQLVLEHLRGKARSRQRILLGPLMCAIGGWGLWTIRRRRAAA